MGQNMESQQFYDSYQQFSYYGMWRLRYEFVAKTSTWLDRPAQLADFEQYAIGKLSWWPALTRRRRLRPAVQGTEVRLFHSAQ